jgi:hypothetical protein
MANGGFEAVERCGPDVRKYAWSDLSAVAQIPKAEAIPINNTDGASNGTMRTVILAKARIQYAAAYRLNHDRLWNTGSPPARG